MGMEGRVWGYTGAGGMVQGFAAGYFLWDLVVCVGNVGVFGWGLLAHAVAALVVFSLGFVSCSLISIFILSIYLSTFVSQSVRLAGWLGGFFYGFWAVGIE